MTAPGEVLGQTGANSGARSPGRPLEFNPNSALEAAMQLFWRRGYEQASLQELLTVMNVSKSSLYQAYGGKQPLFRRCLVRYTGMIVGQLSDDLSTAPSALVCIESFLRSVLDEIGGSEIPRGCLIVNTAIEFSQSDPEISEDLAHCFGRMRKTLTAAVERGQLEGELDPNRSAETLANYLITCMSGLKAQAKAGADREILRGVVDLVMGVLKRP